MKDPYIAHLQDRQKELQEELQQVTDLLLAKKKLWCPKCELHADTTGYCRTYNMKCGIYAGGMG